MGNQNFEFVVSRDPWLYTFQFEWINKMRSKKVSINTPAMHGGRPMWVHMLGKSISRLHFINYFLINFSLTHSYFGWDLGKRNCFTPRLRKMFVWRKSKKKIKWLHPTDLTVRVHFKLNASTRLLITCANIRFRWVRISFAQRNWLNECLYTCRCRWNLIPLPRLVWARQRWLFRAVLMRPCFFFTVFLLIELGEMLFYWRVREA